jgi:hypothetical protein
MQMSEPARQFTDTRQFKVMRTVIGAGNPLMRRLLDSRLAGPMAKQLLLLRYRGRKSGRTITTPVGYVRDGDRIVLVTSPTYRWWRNFVAGADAEFRLPEGWRKGRAEVIMPDDPRYDEVVALQVGKRGPGMLKGFGLDIDAHGRVSPTSKATATDKAHVVLVTLAPSGGA